MLCVETRQRVCGEQIKFGCAVPPIALHRHGPEYSVAFDCIESIKSGAEV